MTSTKHVFIGSDSGATTSKTGGVWSDGSMVSLKLRQSSTNAQMGTEAVIKGWVAGVEGFLAENKLTWDQVQGVGLAIPGPYQRYGVLGRTANLPASFDGWNFHEDYSRGLAVAAGRAIPLVVGNDGKFGGVAEAKLVREGRKASVLMLAPGSGLGCAFIDSNGLPLDGETLAGMEAAHMAAPLQLLNMRPLPCGCGRTWGCVEAYTTLSGMPYLIEELLKRHPDHELAKSKLTSKEKAMSVRSLAQKSDPLAADIFDFQARALGIHAAQLCLALDPGFVVIGGGLMDHEATTPEFRERYLNILREAALPFLWPAQRSTIKFAASELGELSQAIGAALVALYTSKS
ncbi:MAG TPA: ROK family protein [Opitutaceae bacterium]|nr:ROK family protein [Opitutaceae bacterium]